MPVHPIIQRAIRDTFGSLTADAAPEGANMQREDLTLAPTTDDAVTWRVAMLLRVRRLEQAMEDVNDALQVERFRVAEIEREARKEREARERAITELRNWIVELQGRMAA